ncbi:MAG: nucleoside deaminase [Candidatus Diapherotrites archaeon]
MNSKKLEKGMNEAISICRKGLKKGERPFGSAIYLNEKLVAKAHNLVNSTNNPVMHAEINCISIASKKLKEKDWKKCVLFSTCEPCPMCFSAIHWAGIKKIVFGAGITDAKKAGFNELKISNKKMNLLGKVKIKIIEGIEKQKTMELFEFYSRKIKEIKK